MAWIEVSQMALNLMHQRHRVAYLTEQEVQTRANILDNLKSDGFRVVVVTDQQKAKLQAQAAAGGDQVRMLETYVQEYNASFQYAFVDPNALTAQERQVSTCLGEYWRWWGWIRGVYPSYASRKQ
jgi:hypothetical protein